MCMSALSSKHYWKHLKCSQLLLRTHLLYKDVQDHLDQKDVNEQAMQERDRLVGALGGSYEGAVLWRLR